ncbi:hypothetical protein Ddye_010772 [Dipteronia dyeriana]|uniref:Uncharacterized protein n=1 Tax=Dipteronia dyeriana TaxID=168575 RepID=A0AAD9XDU4_9ROSI|nr:hypothetical protein Ddye_010772 [Dipteronia dyeriana]
MYRAKSTTLVDLGVFHAFYFMFESSVFRALMLAGDGPNYCCQWALKLSEDGPNYGCQWFGLCLAAGGGWVLEWRLWPGRWVLHDGFGGCVEFRNGNGSDSDRLMMARDWLENDGWRLVWWLMAVDDGGLGG